MTARSYHSSRRSRIYSGGYASSTPQLRIKKPEQVSYSFKPQINENSAKILERARRTGKSGERKSSRSAKQSTSPQRVAQAAEATSSSRKILLEKFIREVQSVMDSIPIKQENLLSREQFNAVLDKLGFMHRTDP